MLLTVRRRTKNTCNRKPDLGILRSRNKDGMLRSFGKMQGES